MKPDDFFHTIPSDDIFTEPDYILREEVLEDLLLRPLHNTSDLDVAIGLVQLIHNDLEAFGTSGGNRTTDGGIILCIRAAKVVCNRLGLEFPVLPFRDFKSFYKFWKKQDMSGSWAARRDYLDSAFEQLENNLFELEERQYIDLLVKPISPRKNLGWADIDSEIEQLRRKFASAQTEQDYNGIGSACVRILENLGDIVYDPKKHTPVGETPLSRDKVKLRLETVIDSNLAGSSSELKKYSRATIELAQKVKHTKTPSRRDAGIAADATIQIANLVRRILSP